MGSAESRGHWTATSYPTSVGFSIPAQTALPSAHHGGPRADAALPPKVDMSKVNTLGASLFHRLRGPALVLVIAATTAAGARRLIADRFAGDPLAEEATRLIPLAAATVAWLAGGLLLARLLNALVWDVAVARRQRGVVPQLVKQLTTAVVMIGACTGIVGAVFDQSISGILATSGVLGLVLGMALRNLISDLFSGLAMNLEQPFSEGEYIEVHAKGVPGLFGRVEETTWRTTRIITPEGSTRIIPNSELSVAVLTNYSRPSDLSEFEVVIVLEHDVPESRALRVLEAALAEAVLLGGPEAQPVPKVRISRLAPEGVHYKLKYILDPRRMGPSKARHLINGCVLEHLRAAGLRLAVPATETRVAMGPEPRDAQGPETSVPARRAALLRLLALPRLGIGDLGAPAVVSKWAEMGTPRTLAAGASLIGPGQPGPGLVIVLEGAVQLRAEVRDQPALLGALLPGDAFGTILPEPPLPEGVHGAAWIAASGVVLLELPPEILSASETLACGLSERLRVAANTRAASIAAACRNAVAVRTTTASPRTGSDLSDLVGQLRAFFDRRPAPTGDTVEADPVVRAIMAACALVATADGVVSDGERRQTRALFEQIGLLKGYTAAAGMRLFDAHCARMAAGGAQAIDALLVDVAKLRGNPREAAVVLSIARALGLVDGTSDTRAAHRIVLIARALDREDRLTGDFDEAPRS